MKIHKLLYSITLGIVLIVASCDDDEKKEPLIIDPPMEEDMSGFAKGADVSWVTQMEAEGVLFYDKEGSETECMSLLKGLGMNAIRLRVWVNPTDGWCNKTDFLVKAKRANDLNMRLMVDFHYSDWWADPGKQNKPASWESLSFDDLCLAVEDHTTDVLSALNEWGITPEWVQVGNETGNGMLWDDGKASESMVQYTVLNNYGYDAVKAVFPDAKVIVHLQEGNKNSMYRWLFDGLKNNGGKWDVVGMSLYPEPNTWQTLNDELIANAKDMISRYNCQVMICEVGMNWEEEDAAYSFLSDMITRTKSIDGCLGVFYWEPQSHNAWNAYSKGAFDGTGHPTKALDVFSE